MVLHHYCPPKKTWKKSFLASSLLFFVTFLLVLVGSVSVSASESIPSNVNNENDIVTFTLHDNGSSGEGLVVTLHRSEFGGSNGKEFAMEMSTKIEVSKYMAPKPVVADRAFREDGESIQQFDQLKSVGDELRRIYLVAEDLEFIWPFMEYGYKQVVSTNVVPPVGGEPVVLESVSETPRVFRVWNMATAEEATAIIDRALNATGNDALKRSTVGSGTDDNGNELKKEDFGRTSDNAWDWSSPAAKAMIKRSFQLTNIEENDGKRDGLQVVRYKPGQGYNTHPDYFTPERQRTEDQDFDFTPYSGGSNRFATVFMYLNTPKEGGATVFPQATNQDPAYQHAAIKPVTQPPQQSSTMFRQGTWQHLVNNNCYDPSKVAVQPQQGTAALFYSITPDGRIDPSSHHAACPLLDGTKWGANIWIWNKQRFGDLRTGNARKLRITNRIRSEAVHISWEGKPNGVLGPGQSFNMDTFEHHRFKVSFGSHKEKSFASFTVQECEEGVIQKWDIVEPSNYNHHDRRRRQLQHDSREEDDDRQAKKPKTNEEMAVNTKNYLKEKVEILWQGQPLGIDIDGGDTAKLYTFVGHTLQAISTTTSSIISTLTVSPDSNIWKIGSNSDHGDEL